MAILQKLPESIRTFLNPQTRTSQVGMTLLLLMACAPRLPAQFYKGINLQGPAVMIEGQRWLSQQEAFAQGFTAQNAIIAETCDFIPGSQLRPPVSDEVAMMLCGGAWRPNTQPGQGYKLELPVDNGSYDIFLWMLEDYRDYYRKIDVKLEGQFVARGLGEQPLFQWTRYGPYRVQIADGRLTIEVLNGGKGDPSLSGFALYRVEPTSSGTTPAPNQPPRVELVSPPNGATFAAPATVTLQANASDVDGTVVRVEFFWGSTRIAQLSSPPYVYSWRVDSPGNYTIVAQAIDDKNAAGQSSPVTFTVTASSSQPVVLVSQYGAVGNGTADDTVALQRAIDQSPENAIIDFGTGKTYLVSRTIYLRSNRRYRGQSTVRLAGFVPLNTALFELPYGGRNVTIEGLALDANNRGPVVVLGPGGSSIPVSDVTIRNCQLLNGRGWNVHAPAGLVNVRMENNVFRGCSTCLAIVAPRQCQIISNLFEQIESNAINILAYDRPFDYGDGIEIAYNTIRRLKRMGIEVFGTGSRLQRISIHHNEIRDWVDGGDVPFGISLVNGWAHEVTDNVLAGSPRGLGIEVGVRQARIARNQIQGFYHGVVVQGQNDVIIENNNFTRQYHSAIALSNVRSNLRLQIRGNRIVDPQEYGVWALPTDYTGLVAESNEILRGGGAWPGDDRRNWGGLKLDAGLQGTVLVRNNRIVQTASQPVAGFWFHGIGIFGSLRESRLEGNRIESVSSTPLGVGLLLWYSPYLNGTYVVNNQFRNLRRVTNGYTSTAVRASGNTACNVPELDPNIISGTYCGP